MRAHAVILMAVITCCGNARASDNLSPPTGWHKPTPDELGREPLRDKQPTRYVEARADFDGDGTDDDAALFMADDGMSEGVFVKLSSVATSQWTHIETVRHPRASGPLMGIAVAKPAAFTTACGKGHWKCNEGEPVVVDLKHPAIDFFRFESASSIIYWDSAAREFKRISTSD